MDYSQDEGSELGMEVICIMDLSENDRIWCDQNEVSYDQFKKVAELFDGDDKVKKEFDRLFDYGNGNGKHHKKEENQRIQEMVYKFSNRGQGHLRETVIIEGKPQFIKLDYEKVKKQYFKKID